MHSSCLRTRSLTCRPTTEIERSTPRLATSSAALHGSGGAQLSPPSETSTTVRRPAALPRSSGVASSEAPIGVRPLPSSACTVEVILPLSSGPTGIVSSVSLQACAFETSATFEPYTRSPIGAASGRRRPSLSTAVLAASRREPPLPASSFIDFDASSTISARLRVSVVCARATAGTASSAPSSRTSTRTVRRLLLPLAGIAAGDVAHEFREPVRDVMAEVGRRDGRDDHRHHEQDADVLGGRLPARAARAQQVDPDPEHAANIRPRHQARQGPGAQIGHGPKDPCPRRTY